MSRPNAAARLATARLAPRLAALMTAGVLPGVLLAGTALAQMTGPAVSDPARIESGAYSVEPSHTQVLFSVSHMGFSTYYGEFSKAGGSLNLDSRMPSKSSFEIHVPVASVTTTSDKLTGELKSDAWLNAPADPDIIFKSTKVSPTGKGNALVTGNLTLHGVTRPVTLHAKLVGGGINPLDKKYTVGFDLTGTIKRSEFGVKTYVPLIGDAVTLTIAGVFEKQ